MGDLFRSCESFRDPIDDEDSGSTTEVSRVGSHEPNGAGPKDGNSLTRLEIGECKAMPTGWEDIGEERKGGLVCVTLGKGKGIEIGKGNAEVLRLQVNDIYKSCMG